MYFLKYRAFKIQVFYLEVNADVSNYKESSISTLYFRLLNTYHRLDIFDF